MASLIPTGAAANANAANGGTATAGDNLEWKYVQSFGDDTASDGHTPTHHNALRTQPHPTCCAAPLTPLLCCTLSPVQTTW